MELGLALAKSRTIRLIGYIKKLKEKIVKELEPYKLDLVEVSNHLENVNWEPYRLEIRELMRDGLEPGVLPAANTWEKFIDYSQKDKNKVFSGLLDSDCVLNLP